MLNFQDFFVTTSNSNIRLFVLLFLFSCHFIFRQFFFQVLWSERILSQSWHWINIFIIYAAWPLWTKKKEIKKNHKIPSSLNFWHQNKIYRDMFGIVTKCKLINTSIEFSILIKKKSYSNERMSPQMVF